MMNLRRLVCIPLILFALNPLYAVNLKLQVLQVFDIIQGNSVENNLQEKELAYGAIKGMLESLKDPYSRFLEPEKYQEMKVNLSGNFFGIGIHIGMKNDKLTVISPIPDTPADRSGIRAMDTIVSINRLTTEKMSLDEAVSKIRGPEGSKVTLTIKREGVEGFLEIGMLRAKIDIKSVDSVQIITGDVGYVRLLSFESKEATNELIASLKSLKKKGMKRLILDLRNNGGGLLSNAQGVSSLFLDQGIVVYTVDRSGRKMGFPVTPKAQTYEDPLVILINGSSASASEIVAGAIHDNKRGTLVGTHTFGKASVQNIIPLGDGSAILLTIAKYLTPNGNNIHGTGIMPDVAVSIPTADITAFNEGKLIYSIDKDVQLQQANQIVNSL